MARHLAVVSMVLLIGLMPAGCGESARPPGGGVSPVDSPGNDRVHDNTPRYDIRRHVVMVEAETRPRGISRSFPALVMACDGSSSLLMSASWGAEPFPTFEKNGTPIGAVFLREGGEAVEIIGFDERLGVSVLAVEKALSPLPAELIAASVREGDDLDGLHLQEDGATTRVPLDVVGVDRVFHRHSVTDGWIGVEGTIQFTGDIFGNPGSLLLQGDQVAAIFLNNAGDLSQRFALPIDRAVAAYEQITTLHDE